MLIADEQTAQIRTWTGVPIYQFRGDQIASLKWTREQREVSICTLNLAEGMTASDLPVPWLHWLDIYNGEGDQLYWSGPIINPGTDHRSTTVAAADVGAWLEGTRCPVTKRWEAKDPAEIAVELWDAMIETHGLQVPTVTRLDPRGGRFDFSSSNKDGDTEMLDQTIARLVETGQLYWTVVAGTVILGPASLEPVATLGEHDFVANAFRLERDGSQMFNDVVLRAADATVRHRVEAGGLNRQTIRDINSMSGVSNAERAVRQFVRFTSQIRDTITMPGGAVLVPDAPVELGELIPSARFNVEAFGLLTTMQLDQVTVTYSAGVSEVAVKLDTVNDDLPELYTIDSAEGTAL